MAIECRDAPEIQALIHHHASAIASAIEDGGIMPSKRDCLERTCLRMVELSKALAACEVTPPRRPAPTFKQFTRGDVDWSA